MACSYLRKLSGPEHGNPYKQISLNTIYLKARLMNATFLAPMRTTENAADVYSIINNRGEHSCFIKDALSEERTVSSQPCLKYSCINRAVKCKVH